MHLNTNSKENNHTHGSHIDKYSIWGIKLTGEERNKIHPDFLKNLESYREQMEESKGYKDYKKKNSWRKRCSRMIKNWLTPRIVILLILIVLAIATLIVLFFAEVNKANETLLINLRWTAIATVVSLIPQLFPNNK